ncbi:MAG: DUF393 domain-containing protein [Verrucomicrobiales bacterium]|nr:DUF393 domain-containing protein [Verrucomicrobiales bacterium]
MSVDFEKAARTVGPRLGKITPGIALAIPRLTLSAVSGSPTPTAPEIPADGRPGRPVVIYDGDCGFCRRCVAKLKRLTANQIECLDRLDPQCLARFPTLSPAALATSVHFVGIDGRVAQGAEAMFRAAALNSRWRWPLRAYLKSRFLARAAETSYRFVANHRMLVSRLTRPWLPEGPDVPADRPASSCTISRKDK